MTSVGCFPKVVGVIDYCHHPYYWKKTTSGLLGILFVLSLVSSIHAEPSVVKEPLIEHLEFLGYECDLVEAGIRAKHFSKIHLYITNAFGGIRIQTGFPGQKPESGTVSSRYLESNALMKQFSVARLYWSEDGNLFTIAWMPGSYEKVRFSLFMEAWDRDTSLLRQNYEKLKPFLKQPAHVRGN